MQKARLMLAAEETVNNGAVIRDISGIPKNIDISHYLGHDEVQLCLKHLCREAIRKHLLLMGQVNLFFRVPQLEIPLILHD